MLEIRSVVVATVALALAGGPASALPFEAPGAPVDRLPVPVPAPDAEAVRALQEALATPPRDLSESLALQARLAGAALAPQALAEPDLDAALERLFAAYVVTPTEEEQASLAELRAWPAPARDALALVLDAAARAQLASKAAFAGLGAEDLDLLLHGDTGDRDQDQAMTHALGSVDRAALLAAQEHLVRAVLAALPALEAHALELSLLDPPVPDADAFSGRTPRITVANVLAVDPQGDDNLYAHDYAVILDLVGHDVYRNQAGGSGRTGVDYGSSRDLLSTVGNAGVLVDLYGADRYLGYAHPAAAGGLNGGGYLGLGFLVDLTGDDTYVGALAGKGAVNGGASLGGVGLLWDLSGDEAYDALLGMGGGANGGGSFGGLGLVRDEEGSDRYDALLDKRLGGAEGGEGAANGGGHFLGVGLLLDDAGDDVRKAVAKRAAGLNGGGYGGLGFLLDLEGDDTYDAASGNAGAANGCGASQGAGALLDLVGHDAYRATLTGGGACANGAGNGGDGALVDLEGDDRYEVVVQTLKVAANGGGRTGRGWLLDGHGDDRYVVTLTDGAGQAALNGGALEGGRGHLADLLGDDAYLIHFLGASRGAVAANGGGSAGPGLLLDLGGRDAYADEPGEAPRSDESLAPKGTGLQHDQGNPWGI